MPDETSVGILQSGWNIAKSYGMPGVIFFAVLISSFLLGRRYIGKFYDLISAYLQEAKESNTYFKKALEDATRKLDVVHSSVGDAEHRHRQHEKDVEEIASKMDELLKGAEGNMSDQQIIKMVAAYSDKVHSRTHRWWEKRVEQNHILDMEEIVAERYSDKLDEILKKFTGELSGYKYRNKSLALWDAGKGLRVFYEEIFRLLYSIQKDLASNREPAVRPEDLEAMFDRKQSTLMQSVREWMGTGVTLEVFMQSNNHEASAGKIDWLSHPVKRSPEDEVEQARRQAGAISQS